MLIINLKNKNKIEENVRKASIHLNKKLLAKQAKQRRLSRGLTQKELATLARLSRSTIRRFESGKWNTRVSSVLKIFEILGGKC